jgi:chromodomain-helicase-DNA-binding protein 1
MVQPGAYEGMDGVDAPPPAPAAKKAKNSASMRKTATQRAVEVEERHLQLLARSAALWGDIRLRCTERDCVSHEESVSRKLLTFSMSSAGR